MNTIYGMKSSGNCYKVQLLLEILDKPYRWIDVNSAAGETRTPEYLAKNPNGKVPLLETEAGQYLPESNAILCYLASDTNLFPTDKWLQANVLQWLFFEQYSHEPAIAVRIARKHLAWSAAGLRGANAFRVAVNTELEPERVQANIARLFAGDFDQPDTLSVAEAA